jgi:hypothetical protein
MGLLAVYDGSEQFESFAGESHRTKLIDRRVIGRTGLNSYAREVHIDFHIETGHLLHDIVASQDITALL